MAWFINKLSLNPKFLTIVVFLAWSFFCVSVSGQDTQQSTDEDLTPIPPKPIRPIQNKIFYPDIEEDSGVDKCLVAEFRFVALTVRDPLQRRIASEKWVQENAKFCSVAKLLTIRNNRAQWLGTGDSITIDAEVDKQLEIALDKSDEIFPALYGLNLPPPPADDEEVQ